MRKKGESTAGGGGGREYSLWRSGTHGSLTPMVRTRCGRAFFTLNSPPVLRPPCQQPSLSPLGSLPPPPRAFPDVIGYTAGPQLVRGPLRTHTRTDGTAPLSPTPHSLDFLDQSRGRTLLAPVSRSSTRLVHPPGDANQPNVRPLRCQSFVDGGRSGGLLSMLCLRVQFSSRRLFKPVYVPELR